MCASLHQVHKTSEVQAMSTGGLSIPGISVGGPGAGAADLARRTNPARGSALLKRSALLPVVLDATAIVLAVLDVWLVIPEKAQPYSIYLSGAACLALAMRRWFPFIT